MKRIIAVAVGLMTASPAWALDAWMWGVGPKVGTTFLPGRTPVGFPKEVNDDAGLNKTGFDLIIGGNALYYASSTTRLGVDLGADVGGSMFGFHGLLEYNYVAQQQALDFIFGGEAGVATTMWNGDESSRLVLNSFPLRAKIGLMARDNSRAYGGSIFGQFDIPSRQIYTMKDGTKMDGGLSAGLYLTAGLEISVLFGDFTPPRPHHGG
jgi:hypothetical protein